MPLDLIIDDDEEGQVTEHHRMKQPESELHRIAKACSVRLSFEV